jgi:O-antigen/teichoic acid export membrane protein
MQFRSLEIRTVVASGLGGATAIALAFMGAGPWAIVGQKLLVTGASTVLVWRASPWRPQFLVSRASVRHLIGFSGWLVGGRLLSYVNGNADNYLVGRYVGSAGLGAYSIAYNVMLVPLTRLVSPVQQVFYPVLSRIRDARRVGAVWLRSTRMVAFVTVPAFAGMAVVAPDFVDVVLGDQWGDSVHVLQVLCWVGILQTIGWQTVSVLLALERTAWLFRFTVVATVVCVTAFAVGVQWGIVGVAVGYAIASTALTPFYLAMPLRLTGIPASRFLGAISGVVLAAVLMAGSLYALRELALDSMPPALRLAILVAAGVAIYLPLAAWRVPEARAELRGLGRRRADDEGAFVS